MELYSEVPESLGPSADRVHGATGLVQAGPQLEVLGAGVLVRAQVEEERDDLICGQIILGVTRCDQLILCVCVTSRDTTFSQTLTSGRFLVCFVSEEEDTFSATIL